MYCLNRDVAGVNSLLLDFALSGFDEGFVGRKSDPFLIEVDRSAVEKAAYAAGMAVPWHAEADPLGNGATLKPIAVLPYFWHLINNTPTYRAYEAKFVMGDVMADRQGHLHTGDDYRYFEPIVVGDTIAVSCEVTRVYHKTGRQGPMKFIEDVWTFLNQHNRVAGELVRKVVTIDAVGTPPPPPPIPGPDLPALTGAAPKRIAARPWEDPASAVDLFDGREHAFRHEHGAVGLTSMVQWMGAVDDYAKTHYDVDYCRERGFPGDLPITAGPQAGAIMAAPVVAWAGRGGWIEEFRHIQRRSVYPGDVLATCGVARPTADRDVVEVEAWLVDDENRVRNTAGFTIRRRAGGPVGERSRLWLPQGGPSAAVGG